MANQPAASGPLHLLHTDGACKGNPGRGGWGVVLQRLEGGEVIKEATLKGAARDTTNNVMELTAAIEGLSVLKDKAVPVRVVTDSEYVVKGMTEWLAKWEANGWRTAAGKPVSNEFLWRALWELAGGFVSVSWEWTRGHAGHALNQRADDLANAAIAERFDLVRSR